MLTGNQIEFINLKIKNGDNLSQFIQEWDLTGATINNAILDGIILSGKNISNSKFRFCSFKNAVLEHVVAVGCDFTGSDFYKAILSYGNFKNSTFLQANMIYTNGRNADFTFCEFCDAHVTMGFGYMKGMKMSKDYYRYLGKIWEIVEDDYRVAGK